MPQENTWEHDGLYRKFFGEISGHEILESNFELQAHPNFKTIKYIINDFTDVSGHSVETVHTSVYANTDKIVSNSKGNLKIALIVPANSAVTEVAKRYREQMIDSLFACEIFNTVDDANNWVTKA